MYAPTHVRTYVCMYVYIVCIYVCMYVCGVFVYAQNNLTVIKGCKVNQKQQYKTTVCLPVVYICSQIPNLWVLATVITYVVHFSVQEKS